MDVTIRKVRNIFGEIEYRNSLTFQAKPSETFPENYFFFNSGSVQILGWGGLRQTNFFRPLYQSPSHVCVYQEVWLGCEYCANILNWLYQGILKCNITLLCYLQATQMINLLFAAYNGDVSAMRQYFLQGTDMSSSDYDARTALHLAAAEGKSC